MSVERRLGCARLDIAVLRPTVKGGPASPRVRPSSAALWALQVRQEDVAAAALEVGMWPV
jgi:hypothetical protein